MSSGRAPPSGSGLPALSLSRSAVSAAPKAAVYTAVSTFTSSPDGGAAAAAHPAARRGASSRVAARLNACVSSPLASASRSSHVGGSIAPSSAGGADGRTRPLVAAPSEGAMLNVPFGSGGGFLGDTSGFGTGGAEPTSAECEADMTRGISAYEAKLSRLAVERKGLPKKECLSTATSLHEIKSRAFRER
eukprot:TRINITY_DN2797_c0_g1_i2.p1 TRINITY_DN2797_c0_g1~~TRINITY_DN2797_c0_g1_i2.p1  ORF type:complete len:190 (+),score=16.55 TRINITY_DN2797_c0_g1_i2:104-673(+)